MKLGNGLEILVRDWIDLHEQGGSKLTVEAVVRKLCAEKTSDVKIPKDPLEIVDWLDGRLRQIPGALELTENYLAQFSTPDDLLDEMDLDCFVCELATIETDDR